VKVAVFAVGLALILLASTITTPNILFAANDNSKDNENEGEGENLDLDIEVTEKSPSPKVESALAQLISKRTSPQPQSLAVETIEDRVRVVFELESGNRTNLGSLRAEGVLIETSHGNLVQALVPISEILRLSELPFVRFIRTPLKPIPAEVSEGVSTINADNVQGWGYAGSGVKVAIVDVGFDIYNSEIVGNIVEAKSFRADGDIAAGGNSQHGTACAEIVLDVAPDAELYLYNLETDVEFLNAVDYAINKGVDIISASVGWKDGVPTDGTGPLCEKVNQAYTNGILFVTSAGNEAEFHWEGTFQDSDADLWHNFVGEDETNKFSATAGEVIWVFLNWDDWPLSNQNYDLYLYDDGLTTVIASSTTQQTGTQPPAEKIGIYAPYTGTYNIAVRKSISASNINFDLYLSTTYYHTLGHIVSSSSLTDPATASGAFTVGATYWWNDTLTYYSSQGPTNDGRLKPDVTGPTHVATTSYPYATYPSGFTGTSAAAPHVAGAAALLLSYDNTYTPVELMQILKSKALDLGVSGPDNSYGYGRIRFASGSAGTVTLDRISYLPGATVYVTVTDPDMNLSPTSIDTISANGWTVTGVTSPPASVDLTETGQNTGIFTGTVAINNALPGEVMTITYNDLFPVAAIQASANITSSTGTINLDKTTYQAGETATVTVIDPDLNLDSGSTETVSRDTDASTKTWGYIYVNSITDNIGSGILLTETGSNTGIFTGIFTFTTSGSTTQQDTPILRVSSGDNVAALYKDSSDAAGATRDVVDTAVLDASPPTITNLTPANNSFANTTTPTISTVITDVTSGVNASSINMTLDSVHKDPSYNSTTGYLNYTPSPALGEGLHNVTLSVADNASNTNSTSWSFTVDVTAPVVNITEYITPTGVSSQTVNGTYVEGNLQNITVNGVLASAASGTFSATIPLSAGDNNVSAVGLDKAGNQGSDNITITLIDIEPPSITNLTPVNQLYVNSATQTISVTITDTFSNVNASSITLTLNGTSVSPDYNSTSGYLNYTATLNEGLHLVNLSVKDNAGNPSSTSWSFTVDTVTPDLTNPTPAPDSHTSDRRPTFSVNATDLNLNATSITMTINGSAVSPIYNETIGLISYTPAEDLAFGLHQVYIGVEDLAHNSNSTSWSFTVYATWNVSLVLTCDLEPLYEENRFGVHPNATSGYNVLPYDDVAPPAPPSNEYTESYFSYPENAENYRRLQKSTLNTSDTLEWPFVVVVCNKTGAWSGNAVITWNSTDVANVPSDYTLTLKDEQTSATVNMRDTVNHTFTAAIGAGEETKSYNFTVKASTTVEHTFTLVKGWNMIGIPLNLTDSNPDTVFSGYTMWTWDASQKKYVDPSTLDVGVGYWILADNAANVTVEGTQLSEMNLTLVKGWNMIGIPTGLSNNNPDTVFSGYTMWTWDAAQKKYVDPSTLVAGVGYWILADNAATIQLPLS